jgi:hypothetical protein
MKNGTPERSTLVFTALALFGVLCALWSFSRALTFDFRFFGHPGIAAYESRFDDLKDALPARGIIGYATDTPSEDVFSNPEATAFFYVAQYALAPLIVANDPERELVIGNFHRPPALPPGGDEAWSVSRDFGDGLYILRPR